MRDPIEALGRLQEKASDKTYKFERLYRNLYNPEFYMLAYRKVYANKGSMTPGADGTTMDGMSHRRITDIIEHLRNESYRPSPTRRTYIAKKNNPTKKRPLGIPSANDKLVQEVVRMILEAIYEPIFTKHSHGFRPNRSCHTALQDIQSNARGCAWFVEGDITACFDSFDHQILIKLLRKRIEDERFIALIWKFLKAGYMEDWKYFDTYAGTPQGSGVSPVLANIYLHELDGFIESMQKRLNTGNSMQRKLNPEYLKVKAKSRRYRNGNARIWEGLTDMERRKRAKAIRIMEKEMRSLPTRMPCDHTFKQVKYVRYADDFLVCVWGSKKDAERIKEETGEFLQREIHLTLSDSKTKITHATDNARFLGYDIRISRDQSIRRDKNGVRRRVYSGITRLMVPREKWVGKLQTLKAVKIVKNEKGKDHYLARGRKELFNMPDIEILHKYDSEVRGLYNYYSIADNACVIGHFGTLMKWSMLKTFAAKYRTKVSEIKKRYVENGVFTVNYATKKGIKQGTFYNGGYKRWKSPSPVVNPYNAYGTQVRGLQVAGRLRAGRCELCGKIADVEVHQVKSLASLRRRNQWESIMIDKRRKTLVTCPECHKKIHA